MKDSSFELYFRYGDIISEMPIRFNTWLRNKSH